MSVAFIGPEFLVNTNTDNAQRRPTIATDPNGNFIIAWESRDQDGAGFGIYAQRYDSNGIPQGTEFRVNTHTTDGQSDPTIATDPNGNFIIAWESGYQDGSYDGIYAQRFAIPIVSINPGTNPEEEGSTPGTFTFSLNYTLTSPLTVPFEITGTASNPDDYSFDTTTDATNILGFTGTSITLAAGATGATLTVIPIDDDIVEGDESINLSLIKNATDWFILDSMASSATLTIIDNDSVSVNVTQLTESIEEGETGQFEFTLNQPGTADIIINYNITGDATPGDDYTELGNMITIPAGETSVTLDLVALTDEEIEEDETVILTLDTGDSYTAGTSTEATITIIDTTTIPDPIETTPGEFAVPLVDVIAGEDATEGGEPGTFIFTLSQTSTNEITVDYSVGGDAISGADYTPLGVVTFAPGETTATLEVNALLDGISDPNEIVSITINNAPDYNPGTSTRAEITIIDVDSPTPTPPTPTPAPAPVDSFPFFPPAPTPTPVLSPNDFPSAFDPNNRNCSGIAIPQLRLNTTTDTLPGTNDDDTIVGTSASEDIYGTQGNDFLFGESGDDNIYASRQ